MSVIISIQVSCSRYCPPVGYSPSSSVTKDPSNGPGATPKRTSPARQQIVTEPLMMIKNFHQILQSTWAQTQITTDFFHALCWLYYNQRCPYSYLNSYNYVYGVYTDLSGFVYGEKNVLSVLKWSHSGVGTGPFVLQMGHRQCPVTVCKRTPSTMRTVTVYK